MSVKQLDSRFARPNEVKRLGSYYERLKVRQPDEFDIMVPMTSLTSVRISRADRFYGFHRPVPDPRKTIQPDLKIVPKHIALPPLAAARLFLSIRYDYLRHIHKDLMFEDDVIPFLVLKRFKRLVTDAIRSLGLRGTYRRVFPFAP